MRASTSLVVTLGIMLGANGTAQAGRIVTPSVSRSNAADSRLVCSVVNGKAQPVGPFTIAVVRQTGVVADEADVAALQPGAATLVVADDTELAGATLGYCVVEGKQVSAKKTPVTLCVTSAATDDCMGAVTGR